MAIERLSPIDRITASTYFAVNVNNQDYRAAAGVVADFVSEQLNSTAAPETIQYTSPSTSFTYTLTNNSTSTWLAITPTTGVASGTIVLPNVSVAGDGQEILITTTQNIGGLVINANGASTNNVPSSLQQYECFKLKFEPISKVWYRVQSDWAIDTFNFGTY
jgi:hypothetical protein